MDIRNYIAGFSCESTDVSAESTNRVILTHMKSKLNSSFVSRACGSTENVIRGVVLRYPITSQRDEYDVWKACL